MKSEKITNLIYALFFGIVAGLILSFALGVFIPQFYTESVGKLVCSGKVEFVSFKQSYFCFDSVNNSFDVGEAMFWTVLKRAILPAIIFSILAAIIFGKAARFLYQRREAAGF
jgi:ABC-type antimicrobial peptide transport system permease subunit